MQSPNQRLFVAAAFAALPIASWIGYHTSGAKTSILAAHAEAPAKTLKCAPIDPVKHSLKLVQVVFRHGARTPLAKQPDLWRGVEWNVCGQAYEAVPLALTSTVGGPKTSSTGDAKQRSGILAGGCHRGELTKVGQQQALDLGLWLRKRYVEELGLLPGQYSDGAVASRTTNYQRTIATLRGVLTGLYPTPPYPLPATVSSQLDEIMFPDSKTCPHLAVFNKQAFKTMEGLSSSPELQTLKAKLRGPLHWMGEKFWADGRWLFTDVYDVMTTLRAHGKPLPEGMTEELLLAVNKAATVTFCALLAPSLKDEHGEVVLRLSMARLLTTIMGHMDRVAEGVEGSAPMYLYSGHDTSILPLLAALGHDVEFWPPYLSNIIFELWEEPPPEGSTAPPRHLVRMLYNREEMLLQGCEAGCGVELESFRDTVIGRFIMSDRDLKHACHAVPSHDTSMPIPTTSASSVNSDSEGQE